MRTDADAAAMNWMFQYGGNVEFGSWVSIEYFGYSLCRTSANAILIYDCQWNVATSHAQDCFLFMLREAGMHCHITDEGDQTFVYRHALHKKVSMETNIFCQREE